MKEKWRTLLQAMIIPAIYVCLFVVVVALPTIQQYLEIDLQTAGQAIGMQIEHSIFDPTFFPILLFLIVHPVAVFLIGTTVLYFVIDRWKKKKK